MSGVGARFSAVLWDMDGTIVDTEDHWIEAADALVRAHAPEGARLPHGDELVGMSLPDGARLMQQAGVDMSVDEIVELQLDEVLRAVRENGLEWRPGAVDLLRSLSAEGVPLAVVTMSYRRFADVVVELLPGVFDVVIGGDDVEHGKPAPDAYLLAADRLGVDIADCVVIEDSLIGLAAGRAAGAHTIGVPCHVPLTTADASTVWPTLEGRTPDDIGSALALVAVT